MSFTGTNIPVYIDTGISLAGATGIKLYLKKPDYSVEEITSVTTDGNKTVIWAPLLTNFNLVGTYKFQVEFTKAGVKYLSDIVEEQFFEPI